MNARLPVATFLAPLLLILVAAGGSGPEATPAPTEEPTRTPIAVVDGEVWYAEDVTGAVAFRIHRLRVDIHSLLLQETERRVEARLLEREAARRGLGVEELLEEVQAHVPPVEDTEIDAYLAEHPAEATTDPDEVRARVRHYLGESRRLERRVALLERLREEAGYRFLLPLPEPPRTEVDVAGAPARGPEEAPVTIVHFAAFGSRSSARSARKIARLVEDFPGKILWVHRTLLRDRDERGLSAARMALLAAREGRFWQLHDRFFAVDKLTGPDLATAAREVGLTEADLAAARTDPQLLDLVKRDLDAARRSGAPREPSLFVNGRYVSGLVPYEELRGVVVEELLPAGS